MMPAQVNGKTGSLMADVQEDIFYSQLLDDDPEQIRSFKTAEDRPVVTQEELVARWVADFEPPSANP